MVRRLVEKQHVGCGQQQPAQRDAPALSPGQAFDRRVPGRQAQRIRGNLQPPVDVPPVHRLDRVLDPTLLVEERAHLLLVELLRETGADPIEAIEQPLEIRDTFLDVSAHVLGIVENGFLRQVAHANSGLGPCLPVMVPVPTRHDAQQGRLACAVQTEHANLGAGKERQRDVLQDFTSRRHHLGDAAHGVYVLIHGAGSSNRALVSPSMRRCGFGRRIRTCVPCATVRRQPLRGPRDFRRRHRAEDCRRTRGMSVAGGTPLE